MISRNIRHLRLFVAVADLGSLTRASARHHISQPAVTQAIGKLESQSGGMLFERTTHGLYLTERGEILARRLRRAFGLTDPALAALSPRLPLVATTAQLTALIAVCEAENFTLAARALGLSQPSVHRAVRQLEQEIGDDLFTRTPHGLLPRRAALDLARRARLAFAELNQADADLAEFDGRDGGRITIGALPLSRSALLPWALARFRQSRPFLPVRVLDGPYADLLTGLRRGDIDVIVGALRDPPPIDDVTQEALFDDSLAIIARKDHPLAGRKALRPAELTECAWLVPREGTPSRRQFNALFEAEGPPRSIIETGSILLMREMMIAGDFLGCISCQQAEAEIARGLIARLDVATDWPVREIGLTTRREWEPTAAQRQLIDILRTAAARLGG